MPVAYSPVIDHRAEHAERDLCEVDAAEAALERVVAGGRRAVAPARRRSARARARRGRRRGRARQQREARRTQRVQLRQLGRDHARLRDGGHAAGLVLDGVAGELHERLLERRVARGELVQREARRRRRDSPIASVLSPSTSSTPGSSVPIVTPSACSSSRRRVACGERTRTTAVEACAMKSAIEHVGEQPPAPDDDQVVGRQRHLAHQVRGDEDRAALGGQPAQQRADPVDALGVEAVDRLVEHERRPGRRAAPRRSRAAGPCRARTCRRACGRPGCRPTSSITSSHAARARCRGSARAPAGGWRPSGPGGWSAPPAARRRGAAARAGRGSAAVDRDLARGRRVEPEDHPHRRRLAGAVGAEEAGHDARAGPEREPVHGRLRAVALRQFGRFDHPDQARSASPSRTTASRLIFAGARVRLQEVISRAARGAGP